MFRVLDFKKDQRYRFLYIEISVNYTGVINPSVVFLFLFTVY